MFFSYFFFLFFFNLNLLFSYLLTPQLSLFYLIFLFCLFLLSLSLSFSFLIFKNRYIIARICRYRCYRYTRIDLFVLFHDLVIVRPIFSEGIDFLSLFLSLSYSFSFFHLYFLSFNFFLFETSRFRYGRSAERSDEPLRVDGTAIEKGGGIRLYFDVDSREDPIFLLNFIRKSNRYHFLIDHPIVRRKLQLLPLIDSIIRFFNFFDVIHDNPPSLSSIRTISDIQQNKMKIKPRD